MSNRLQLAIYLGKDFWQSVKGPALELWRSIPAKGQAAIVAGASAAATSFCDAVFTAGAGFWHFTVIKHTLGAAASAGIVAVRVFFMRPGPGPQGAPPISGS